MIDKAPDRPLPLSLLLVGTARTDRPFRMIQGLCRHLYDGLSCVDE